MFPMGFVAVHFDQFLANLVRVWFVNASCTDDPQIRVFIMMMTDTRERFVYKRMETNTA